VIDPKRDVMLTTVGFSALLRKGRAARVQRKAPTQCTRKSSSMSSATVSDSHRRLWI